MSNKKPTYQDLEKLIKELKSENNLNQSEDRFNMLLQASEDMITIHQPNGKYLYYNGPTCYAITPEDIVGKMPNDIFDKEATNTLLNAFKKVEETGKSETIEVLLDWLGEKKWFSEYIYPIKNTDGEVVEMVKVCRDIHQRKIAEQKIETQNKALLESEKAYKNVVETTFNLITVVDHQGKILFINHASINFYGLTPQECNGRSVFEFTHPEDVEFTKNEFNKWVNSGSNTFYLENRQISTTGNILNVAWNINLELENNDIVKITSIGRDITAQKKSETRLRMAKEKGKHADELIIANNELIKAKEIVEKNEKNLNKVQEIARIGSWHLDLATNEVTWTKELFKMYGFDPTLPVPPYTEHQKLFTPESWKSLSVALAKTSETGIPYELELKTVRENGSNGWMWVRGETVTGKDNKTIGLWGAAQDISERKELELDLILAKEKLEDKNLIIKEDYRRLFDNATISIWNEDFTLVFEQIDELRKLDIPDIKIYLEENPEVVFSLLQKLKINSVNNATLKLFKAASDQDFLDNIQVTFGEGAYEVWRDLIESIWNNKQSFTAEVNYKTLKGDEFAALFSIHIPQTELEQKTVPVSIQSIQAIRDAESEKRKSLKKLNEAQKLAHIGSWLFNPSNQKSEWSDEMFHIWGFDPKKGTPEFDSIIKLIHPDDLELFNGSLDKAVNLGIPYDIEFRICNPNFEKKSLRGICHPVLGNNGEVISLNGTNQDITRQKIFEAAQVKDHRLKAIGEMSSSIAHDFNNALQAMMGNLEIVKYKNDFSDRTLESLNNIGNIIADIAGRVNALQKFGDTVHEDKNAKPIDFNTLIEESLKESRPLWKDDMEKEGLKVTVITEFGDIPKIRCNSGELKSAIYNIIKNGIEAMSEGGDLTIKTGVKTEGVFASFTDTGTGMDEESKSKIFQPFYSTKGFKLGRGLGMSGVYSTVKKFSGTIGVKSSGLAQGTTIEMAFPISEPEGIIARSESDPMEKTSFSVLWVDDDRMITKTVSGLIELIGHKCTIVNSGKDALEYLDNNTCDIVITDIGMPEMNGWELADTIRDKFGDQIKIGVVSGWGIDQKVKVEHAIDFVLQKPFTMEELKNLFLTV
ncbi:MAG: PAS domain S-box protein [Reichenbachiella sp.]